MTANLGTAAYKLVLDARDFGANAVQSGRAMKEVQQVMRQTQTPAERMAKSYDSVTEAWKKGQIPAQNYERYLKQLNTAANQNSKVVQDMVSQYGRGIPIIGKYVGMIGTIHPAVIAATVATAGLVAAFKAGQFYFRQIGEQFADIDAIAKRSKATGFDPTSLVGVERAAALSAGMDTAVTEKSLAIFVRRLGEVKMGTGEAKRAFDLLGLSGEKLTRMAPIEAMQKVSDRFRHLETTAEKAAVAQMLFGKAGAQLVPLLNEGGEALAKYVEEAEALRLGFTLEEAAAVELYNDTVADMQRQWTGFWRTVAIEAAPQMTKAVQSFNEAIKDPDVQRALEDTLTLMEAMARTMPIIATQATGFAKGMAAASGFLTPYKGLIAEARAANEAAEQMEKFAEQMTGMFDPLGTRNAGAAGGSSLFDFDAETPISEGMKQVDSLIDRYQDLIETYSMATRTAELYRLERSATTDEERRAVEAAHDLADQLDELDWQEKDRKEQAESDIAFQKMLDKENEKLEKATEEQRKFFEKAAIAAEEKEKQRRLNRPLVTAEEGVRAGSAEATRGARMQWLGAAEKTPETRLERQGDEQVNLLEQLVTNTQTMVQAPQVVRVQGAF